MGCPSSFVCGYECCCWQCCWHNWQKNWFRLLDLPCLPLLPSLRAPLNFSYLQQKCSLPLQVFHHVQKRKASSCCQETKNNLILLSTRTCDQVPHLCFWQCSEFCESMDLQISLKNITGLRTTPLRTHLATNLAHTNNPMASYSYDSSSSTSSSSDDDEPRVPDLSSLSPEALAALQWHFAGSPPEKEEDDESSDKASKDPAVLLASVTQQLNTVTDTFERLKAAGAIKAAQHQGELHENIVDVSLKTRLFARPSTSKAVIGSPAAIEQAHVDLLTEGVVRLNNCLPEDLCRAALGEVNQQMRTLDQSKRCGERTREEGFGGVLARKCRFDAYQRPTGAFQDIVSCAVALLLLCCCYNRAGMIVF